MKFYIFLFLSLAIFSRCSSDKSDMVLPSDPVLNDSVVVTFSKDIVPIMETYCYGTGGQNCHVSQSNQGASGDFTTCIGLVDKVNNGSMETRVFDPEGDMPPSYSLSPTELTDSALQILKLWVNQGTSCD
ncbi:MAG: hypothetical protein H0V61_10205 [Chitinophagales bacterium]|nr:hypothetical protein [Chitinophagales bacterium]